MPRSGLCPVLSLHQFLLLPLTTFISSEVWFLNKVIDTHQILMLLNFLAAGCTAYCGFFLAWLGALELLLLLLSCFSRVQLCVTPRTAAHQAPPSLGFSR